MFKTNQDQYAGIIPVIPEGTYQLKIKSVNFKEPLAFKVVPNTIITEPKVIIDSYRTENGSALTLSNTASGTIEIWEIKKLTATEMILF
ncbi:hypothetical protein [Pedobacter hartonius]|nr:hypothetical protein [Pedobacter hartonius]